MLHIPNLSRPIRGDEIHFPQDYATNRELIAFMNSMVRPHPSLAVEVFMIFDIVQAVFTFASCAFILITKKRGRNISVCTLRKSPYGTFIVPNAVITLLLGVCMYLFIWSAFCSWVVFVQRTDRQLLDWLWFIPYPWLPLALGAFYSAYGFIITCSPRSPISNLGGRKRSNLSSARWPWMHLPIPHSAWIMNGFLITVGASMIIFNTVVQWMNLAQRNLTYAPGHDIYSKVLTQHHSEEFLDAKPTAEFAAFLKVGWVDELNGYRFCCIALASYMALIAISVIMLVLYALPNQIFLMDHLCRMFPDAPPKGCEGDGFASKLKMLRKIGSPRNLKGSSYAAFKKTWMMTIIGHSQCFLLLLGLLAFSVPAYFLYFVPWTNAFVGKSSDKQVMFIIAYTITAAFLTATWVTALSATMTFEDIFNAISGLGVSNDSATSTSGEMSSAGQTQTLTRTILAGAKGLLAPRSPVRSSFGVSAPGERRRSISGEDGILKHSHSFAPSSAETIVEKIDEEARFEDLARDKTSRSVYVMTQTTIRVERDLEANEEGVEDVPELPRAFSPGPEDRDPYSFLSRKKTQAEE